MPEAASKKKASPVGGRSSSKNKNHNSASPPPIPQEEVLPPQDVVPEDIEKMDEVVLPPKPPTPPPYDVMKNEPTLCTLIIESFEGSTDDQDFYHGDGEARFVGGHSYRGLFQHGKMHGYGVYCWQNGTIFSGDFQHNVISGKGRYGWPDGSSYEGEVMNGMRHGEGTFQSADKKTTYAGSWNYGKRHGKGVMKYDIDDISFYDGDWVDNDKCGYGVRRYKSGNVYEGEWENNLRHGQGTMYWYDKGQEYTGAWYKGVQHGHGESIWYLQRITNSQYPLRNQYVGEFVQGERHGQGVFYYANGSSYEGEWKRNTKDGNGSFTFKNGSVCKCQFKDDHMVDFPDLILSGMTTPDITSSGIPIRTGSGIRSGTPLRTESSLEKNSTDGILDINIEDLFDDLKLDIDERQNEMDDITCVILRFITPLKRLYKFYSGLGVNNSADNTFVMTQWQFWRFMKDHNIHQHGFSLVQMDRAVFNDDESGLEVHDGQRQVFIKDFLTNLIKIAHLIFKDVILEKEQLLSRCLHKLLSELPSTTKTQSFVFKDLERAQEALQYYQDCTEIFHYFCTESTTDSPQDLSMPMRKVLFVYQDLHLLSDNLNTSTLVRIMTHENLLEGGEYNLDVELTPLEFFEIVVESSRYFITASHLQQRQMEGHIEMPTTAPATVHVDESFNEEVKKEIENPVENDNEVDIPTDHLGESSDKPFAVNVDDARLASKPSRKGHSKDNRRTEVTTSKSKEKHKEGKVDKNSSSMKMGEGEQKSGKKLKDSPTQRQRKTAESSLENPPRTSENPPLTSDATIIVNDEENVNQQQQENVPTNENTVDDKMFRSKVKINEDYLHRFNLEPTEDTPTWSLKLNIFLKEFVLPSFHSRKEIDQALALKKEKSLMESVPDENVREPSDIDDTKSILTEGEEET